MCIKNCIVGPMTNTKEPLFNIWENQKKVLTFNKTILISLIGPPFKIDVQTKKVKLPTIN